MKDGGIAILLSKGKPGGMKDSMMGKKPMMDEGESSDDGKIASAKALLAAIKSDSPEALSSALEDFYSQCGE